MTLCAGFSTPLGRERAYRTTYSDFAGLSTRFAPASASPAQTQPDVLTTGGESRSLPMPTLPSPSESDRAARPAIPRRRTSLPRSRPTGPRKKVSVEASATAVPQPDRTPIANQSPLEGIPQVAPRPAAAELDDSPEALRDAFEADPSKFPLDAKVWADGVFLRLAGLCRVKGRYILKAAVTNRSGDDFFVKEFGAYNGEDVISVRSHIRLFVEPGRTREGYVVFAPPPGAQVKIKLKEDREKGRVLEVPVPYPF